VYTSRANVHAVGCDVTRDVTRLQEQPKLPSSWTADVVVAAVVAVTAVGTLSSSSSSLSSSPSFRRSWCDATLLHARRRDGEPTAASASVSVSLAVAATAATTARWGCSRGGMTTTLLLPGSGTGLGHRNAQHTCTLAPWTPRECSLSPAARPDSPSPSHPFFLSLYPSATLPPSLPPSSAVCPHLSKVFSLFFRRNLVRSDPCVVFSLVALSLEDARRSPVVIWNRNKIVLDQNICENKATRVLEK